MRQTVKFGKIRATADPDKDQDTHGKYYGSNIPPSAWRTDSSIFRCRITRGAFVKRG